MKSVSELYSEHDGLYSDKWELYLAEYGEIFSEFRNLPVNLLEIGVQNGGSLEIWAKYFQRAKNIVGCDINPDCSGLSFADERITFLLGDAFSAGIKQTVLGLAGRYHLVVDDGSHKSGDIVRCFSEYFSHVEPGGLFVAEDLHCSYWEDYEGGLYYPYSSIAFFKRLVDVINSQHWGMELSTADLLRGFNEEYSLELTIELLSEIHSIKFVDSMCVVRKRSNAHIGLGSRIIVGTTEIVTTDLKTLPSVISVPPQDGLWSQLARPPEEDWSRLASDVDSYQKCVDSYQKCVDSYQKRVEKLERDAGRLEAELRGMLQSKSWRLTRPLRFVGSKLKALLARLSN
ncbi:MAG: hypothetical protein ACI9G5_000737 [Paracoccaceae bacterium]|jgi:hypothetical protein